MTDSEAIRDVVARYNLYGDSGRFDQLLALFSEDATVVTDRATYAGRDAIRGLFETAAGPAPEEVRHFTATHVIEVDGDLASSRCYFQVLTSSGLDHWGRYRDQLTRIDGRWLFTRREVRVDGMTPGGWADQRTPGDDSSGHEAP